MSTNDHNLQPPEELSVTCRKRLPHWEYQDSIYFITWKLHKDQPSLESNERGLVVSTLKYFNGVRYNLFCFVVMEDHVHLLVRPHYNEKISKLLHSWKSFTANRLQREYGRKGSVWQEEYFDRIIRNERHFYGVAK